MKDKFLNSISYLHGIISIIGAIVLSYLTMMCFSKFIPLDAAIKIIPAYILTPLLIPFYGIWLLFSKNSKMNIIKLLSVSLICTVLLKVF